MKLFLLTICAAFLMRGQPHEIVLLIGQSNMAGRGVVEEQDRQPIPRVFMLNKAMEWVPAVDPVHFDKPDIAGVGLARSFAKGVGGGRSECVDRAGSSGIRRDQPGGMEGWRQAVRGSCSTGEIRDALRKTARHSLAPG